MTPNAANYSDFRRLEVWHDAIELVTQVYRRSQSFPIRERYGLTAQLRRAAVSVPTNIAEGYGRETLGEYINQLSVARGSLNEVETLCAICTRLGFGDTRSIEQLADLVSALQRRLTRLRTRLAEKKKRPRERHPRSPKP